jgi:DNA replication protein DnaC
MSAAFEPERDEGSWLDDEDPAPPLDDVFDAPAPAPAPPRASVVIAPFDFSAAATDFARRWAASPHRCGCGERVLRAGEKCDACAARDRERRDRLRHVGATSSSLPTSYRWAHFSAPELTSRIKDARAIALAKAAATDPDIDRIVFTGPAGAGKTSLACSALHQIAYERSVTGQYVDARSLSLARSQSGLGHEAPIVAEAMSAPALLIDDIGLDRPDQHGSAVADVLYARFMQGQITICTLAIPTSEVADRYGDGIARRMFERAVEIEVHR